MAIALATWLMGFVTERRKHWYQRRFSSLFATLGRRLPGSWQAWRNPRP